MSVAPVDPVTIYELSGTNLGPFATVWPFELDADLVAVLTTPATSLTLTEGVNFTTSETDTLAGGANVTLSDTLMPGGTGPWVAGTQLTLSRDTPRDQPSVFGELDVLSPKAIEAAIDHIERQIQELAAAGGGDIFDGLIPAPGQLLIWSESGTVVSIAIAQLIGLIAEALAVTGAAYDGLRLNHDASSIEATRKAPVFPITGESAVTPTIDNIDQYLPISYGSGTVTVTLNTMPGGANMAFEQADVAQLAFVAGGGVTINSRLGLTSIAQGAVVQAKWKDATTITLFGELTT